MQYDHPLLLLKSDNLDDDSSYYLSEWRSY